MREKILSALKAIRASKLISSQGLDRIAKIISHLLNPLLILPLLNVWLLTFYIADFKKILLLSGMQLMLLAILPIVALKHDAKLSWYDLFVSFDDAAFRSEILKYSGRGGFLLLIIFQFLVIPKLLSLGPALIICTILLLLMIPKTHKLSLHSLAVTASILVVMSKSSGQLWPIIFLIPLICWARERLGKHTQAECLSGMLLGTVVAIIFHYFIS